MSGYSSLIRRGLCRTWDCYRIDWVISKRRSDVPPILCCQVKITKVARFWMNDKTFYSYSFILSFVINLLLFADVDPWKSNKDWRFWVFKWKGHLHLQSCVTFGHFSHNVADTHRFCWHCKKGGINPYLNKPWKFFSQFTYILFSLYFFSTEVCSFISQFFLCLKACMGKLNAP